MKVSELTSRELKTLLRSGEFSLRTGPFRFALQSELPAIASGVAGLYADFPLNEEHAFVDFRIVMSRPALWRRWLLREDDLVIQGFGDLNPFGHRMAMAYLEWGLNWCIYNTAHQYLLLHAAVVEREGRAAVLVGRSGAGKSTLCAALMLAGWRLLSDEIAIISTQDGALHALARPINIKNDAIDVIRRRSPEAVFGSIMKGSRKGTVTHLRPTAKSVERMDERAAPAWFVLVDFQPGVEAQLQRVGKAPTLMKVAKNAFNYTLLGKRGFDALASAIDASDCYRITYGDLDSAVARLDQLAACELAGIAR